MKGDDISKDTLIADRFEIADLVTRMGRLLDEKRWSDAGTVFADDVALPAPRGGGEALRGIGRLVDFLRQAEVEGEHTQHVVTDLLVDLDGDRAEVSANGTTHYFRDGSPPHRTGGLRLAGKLERTPAGWRIAEWQTTPVWLREN